MASSSEAPSSSPAVERMTVEERARFVRAIAATVLRRALADEQNSTPKKDAAA